MNLGRYIFNNLIAADQLGNTLTGGAPDETLSARAYRSEVKGRIMGRFFRPVIDFIFLPFGRGHCLHAYVDELKNRQLPKDYQ
jgi:hypothetical protein